MVEMIQTIQSVGQSILMVLGGIFVLSAIYSVRMDKEAREAGRLLRRILRYKPEKAREIVLHMKEILQ